MCVVLSDHHFFASPVRTATSALGDDLGPCHRRMRIAIETVHPMRVLVDRGERADRRSVLLAETAGDEARVAVFRGKIQQPLGKLRRPVRSLGEPRIVR